MIPFCFKSFIPIFFNPVPDGNSVKLQPFSWSCDNVYNDASCVIPPPRWEHDYCMIFVYLTQIFGIKY